MNSYLTHQYLCEYENNKLQPKTKFSLLISLSNLLIATYAKRFSRINITVSNLKMKRHTRFIALSANKFLESRQVNRKNDRWICTNGTSHGPGDCDGHHTTRLLADHQDQYHQALDGHIHSSKNSCNSGVAG